MQDGARLVEREDGHALLLVPRLAVQRLEGLLEFLEPALRLQGDLEFGQVDVLGVTEARQEQAVHDLGQHLVARPDAAVGGDVEDDRVGRDLLVDGVEDDVELGVVCARAANRFAAGVPKMLRSSIARPSTLAKLDLPDPKKPEIQMATPSCGFCGVSWYRSSTCTKCFLMASVTTYSSISDAMMSAVGLVDLDDLLDLPSDVVVE